MTARSLTSSELPQLVPSLFENSHTVVLVPTAADARWASRTAWAFARAAATGGRRVLLVDLCASTSRLDGEAVRATPKGVAEAIHGNLALEEVAVEQDIPGLYYIGRGSLDQPSEAVWSSSRWNRLARGFAAENALLVLYAPVEALAKLDLERHDVVAIAADLMEARARMTGDRTPFAVVTAGAPHRRVSAAKGRRSQPSRVNRSGRRTSTYAGLAIASLVLAAALGVAWPRSTGTNHRQTDVSRPPATRATTPVASPGSGDTLYYSVQIAAYNSLPEAMARAQKLEGDGRVTIVTPARLVGQALWYRVLVGALPTARAADSVLRDLWQAGTLERPQGTILRAPDTYRIHAQRGEIPALRARGIPAYIVPAPDGTDHVYAGAFDVAEQARVMDSLLAAAHLTGILSKRVGTPP